MNKNWAQYWVGLFANNTDELMTLYSSEIEFDDVNFGVQITKNLVALRQFYENFANIDENVSYSKFDVFDYVGDGPLARLDL